MENINYKMLADLYTFKEINDFIQFWIDLKPLVYKYYEGLEHKALILHCNFNICKWLKVKSERMKINNDSDK